MGIDDIYKRILSNWGAIEGVTISGGEPFQQTEPLLRLLRRVRLETSLSVLVFSGYTVSQIKKLRYGEALLMNIDVLIAGPYVDRLRSGENLCGSSNQKIHLMTNRYNIDDMVDLPSAEVQIDAKGNIHITGFPVMKSAELQ
jgi:anaerobic ribonucleoside-triphosphate reductase activating protein